MRLFLLASVDLAGNAEESYLLLQLKPELNHGHRLIAHGAVVQADQEHELQIQALAENHAVDHLEND